MKSGITINSSDLLHALSRLAQMMTGSIVESHAHVRVICRGESAIFTATNAHMTLNIEVKASGEGEFTFPGKKVHSIVSLLPKGVPVSITYTPAIGDRVEADAFGLVHLRCGAHRSKVGSIDPSVFVVSKHVPVHDDIEIGLGFFLDGIKAATPTVGDSLHMFSGYHFIPREGSGLSDIYSFNGFSMTAFTDEVAIPAPFVLSSEVAAFIGAFSPGEGVLSIGESTVSISSKEQGISMVIRKSDTNSPAFREKIAEMSFPNQVRAPSAEMIMAINRVSILVEDRKMPYINVGIGDSITLESASSDDDMHAHETVKAIDHQGPGSEFGINYRSLKGIFSLLQGDILLDYSNSTPPVTCRITSPSDPRPMYIILSTRK